MRKLATLVFTVFFFVTWTSKAPLEVNPFNVALKIKILMASDLEWSWLVKGLNILDTDREIVKEKRKDLFTQSFLNLPGSCNERVTL